ncbi:MAG: septal ring lytic transglycosylase RlpA family protein [Bacteroidales bacterium]|jgi:rare lipoprotein A|nr:septal ring lytic transglycosylase RlpA family protein [Bacteroidales bacterium]
MVKKLIIIFLLLIPHFSYNQQEKKVKVLDKKATYYHNKFVNRKTSSGERFDQTKYTAAHKTIPLHTLVKVTNTNNGRSVIVKINDRCPKKGVIDLSLIAAKQLKMIKEGVAPVKVEILSNDYMDIWLKQDEVFSHFDQSEENDSINRIVPE